MIPYFSLTSMQIGPVLIQSWGLFVALGIFVGTLVSTYLAKKRGLQIEKIWDLSFWCILSAMIGARLFHVLFYDLAFYLADPLEILQFWHGGYSSVGGMIGAFLMAIFLLKKWKLNLLDYLDVGIFGLPVGLFVGRIGCFLIHDHPGLISNNFLAVDFPNGIGRYDLGLLLSLNGLLLAIVFWIVSRFKMPIGIYLAIFLLWYGLSRFLLDFLRATDGLIVDERYFGLTPAQYVSLGMIVGGSFLAYKIAKNKKLTAKN